MALCAARNFYRKRLLIKKSNCSTKRTKDSSAQYKANSSTKSIPKNLARYSNFKCSTIIAPTIIPNVTGGAFLNSLKRIFFELMYCLSFFGRGNANFFRPVE